MLAGGWERNGGGRISFNFWCRREYNYPPTHILLFFTTHYTLLIIVIELKSFGMFLIKSIFSTSESALSHSSHAQMRMKTDID
jgi:hypothetical protein